MKRKVLNKKRFTIFVLICITIISLIITLIVKAIVGSKTTTVSTKEEINKNQQQVASKPVETGSEEKPAKQKPTDWRLILANYENIIPEDYEIELEDLDEFRQFDARAIKYLKQMINDMRKDGITNIWAQSTYRSVAKQKKLYDESVKNYIEKGRTTEQAIKLTQEYINKPGTSDHNLGLAVDFNYVDNKFEEMEGFKWLQKNAEKYGFVLRYPKDKENITKIKYESWHWRYVGEENAKKMNELNMCLEEYVEYLSK